MNGTRRPELRRGRIIWATFRGRKGIELHPAVVLTPTNQLPDSDDPDVDDSARLIDIIGASSSYPTKVPPEAVELPWHRDGHPYTKLHKRTAAFIGWYDSIALRDIRGYGGDVPQDKLKKILQRTDEYRRRP